VTCLVARVGAVAVLDPGRRAIIVEYLIHAARNPLLTVITKAHRGFLLQAHRTAYCVMSGANLPCMLRATTDFMYLRMHGPDHHHLHSGSYPDTDLTWWADRR
jgi:hypothetical protein